MSLTSIIIAILLFSIIVLFHELGHFLDPSVRWATPQQTREINADQLAVELGLGKSLQTALDKLINEYNSN